MLHFSLASLSLVMPVAMHLMVMYVRESSPGMCAFRADEIILLADEDCSKDMLIDIFGADPTRCRFKPNLRQRFWFQHRHEDKQIQTLHHFECYCHYSWLYRLRFMQQETPQFVW